MIRFAVKRIRWILLILLVLGWTTLWIVEIGTRQVVDGKSIVQGELAHEFRVNLYDSRKHTVILLYSKDIGQGYTTLDYKYFQRMNCPVTSCIVTTNRSFLSSIDDFDAVVFSHKKIQRRIGRLPNKRSWKQNYILLMEKPSEDNCLTVEFRNFFNMTMSYRSDSDILFQNGRVISKRRNTQVAPNAHGLPNWGQIPQRPNIHRDILANVQKKDKMAAWITDECNSPPSENMKLVQQLGDHFRIDFAGPCGNIKCYSMEECLEKIEMSYKFLIHFEDVFSHDYVTSDTFFVMRYKVLPILFGSARYRNFLPPKSYISAKNFTSAEKLGEFIAYLDSDIIEYTRHFWWKAYFYMQAYPNYCDLCMKTRQFRFSNQTRYYTDLNAWLEPFEEETTEEEVYSKATASN